MRGKIKLLKEEETLMKLTKLSQRSDTETMHTRENIKKNIEKALKEKRSRAPYTQQTYKKAVAGK